MKLKLTASITVLLFLLKVSNSSCIDLTKEKDNYSFQENIYLYKDKNSKLDISEINTKAYSDSFQLVDQQNRIMNDRSSTYWLKIPLYNDASGKNWILEFFDFRLFSLTLFDESNKELTAVSHYAPFNKRSLQHKNFAFSLPLKEGASTVYFVRIKIDKTCYIAGLLRSYQDFTSYSNEEYFLLALFYGILFTLIAYNILVYFSIRDLTHVYYSFYILSVCLLTASRDNMGFQFLWNNYPEINRHLFPLAELALIFSAALYAVQFLELKTKELFLYKLIKITLAVRILIFLIGWMLQSAFIYQYWYDLVPLLMLLAAGIKSKMDGYKPAGFYLAGFGFVTIGFIVSLLIDGNFLPSTVFTFYSLNASIIIESLFLSLAIGSKIRNIYIEKEKNHLEIIDQMKINEDLKEKVNRELEEKVQDRTMELEEKTAALLSSNQKLKELSEALNEINSRLDRDNWKLNQEVTEKTKDRIISKELSYEEFSKVFSDELSCMRYLEEIKWKNGYVCKKCANTKYSEGEIKFSRKCTRCDYIETVKSHTIFQGIKFPLQKCFFILYIITNSKRKVTLTELSTTLDLRLNTCSDFRKKVDKKIEKIKTEHWEELVLD
jgi:hypothetical protein